MLHAEADRPLPSAPVAGGPPPLPRLVQTTRDLPARQQFDAWRDANAGLVEYHRPAASPERYEVEATTWRFGGLALMTAETPPGAYRRSAAGLRGDGLDLWSFSMATHGQRIYRTQDQVTAMRPGELVLHSLAQPFDAARTASGWLHLYLPREQLPGGGRLAAGCHRLDTTPEGRLLRDHLLLLAAELPRMDATAADRMAEATRAMIALAVTPGAATAEAASAPVASVQMARLRALIRAHLGAATLGPARLCQMAGISRSQLYRLFEPHGGVALFIQRERLAAAHRALSDPAETRGVREIAEAVGLFDPSSFSRMFRRSYGASPRELRLARSAGAAARPAPSPGAAEAASTLATLLRGLQGGRG